MEHDRQCPLCGKTPRKWEYRVAGNYAMVDCVRCGRFLADPFLGKIMSEELREAPPRYLLSAATRRASDAGDPLVLAPINVREIADGETPPRGVLAKLDRLIELVADRTPRIATPTTFSPEDDYPLGPFLDAEEVAVLLSHLERRGWFSRPQGVLTIEGWARADELRAKRPTSRLAFVAMAFSDDLRQAYVDGFKPGIEASRHFVARRVDDVPHNAKICDAIVAAIKSASLVIVDATHFRLNVFFEAGWAYGLGLPVIWTCREDQKGALSGAFDTRQYNHILWDSPDDLASKLDARIRATVLPASSLRGPSSAIPRR